MTLRMRAIIINVSILAGLLFMFLRGSGVLSILIAGSLCLFVANVILVLRAKATRT